MNSAGEEIFLLRLVCKTMTFTLLFELENVRYSSKRMRVQVFFEDLNIFHKNGIVIGDRYVIQLTVTGLFTFMIMEFIVNGVHA